MASFTTCSGGWLLIDDEVGQPEATDPLPRRGLRLTGIFIAVIAVGLLVGWIFKPGSPEVAQVGKPAPDFTVELIDGGEVTLSELDGPIVLNLWASWCSPCRVEIPDISTYAQAHPEVTVLGVAVQDVDSASREFAAKVGAQYPLALGTDQVEAAYPVLGLPATFVIDQNMVVVEFYNGIVTPEILEGLVPTT